MKLYITHRPGCIASWQVLAVFAEVSTSRENAAVRNMLSRARYDIVGAGFSCNEYV